jgi:hypothetical protein
MSVTPATTSQPDAAEHVPGDLGRELAASALLLLMVIGTSGLIIGVVLGALWLFA